MEMGIPLTLGDSVSSFVHFLQMWAKLPFKEIFPTDMHTEKKPPFISLKNLLELSHTLETVKEVSYGDRIGDLHWVPSFSVSLEH